MPSQPQVDLLHQLTPAEVDEVRHVVAEATDVDGVGPLSEQARLDLSRPGRHLVVRSGGHVAAYAGGDADGLELVVAPAHRGQGLGGALLDAALAGLGDAEVHVWAHGDLPPARRLLASRGFLPGRDLRKLGRPLAPTASELEPAVAPEGLAVRHFVPGDEEAVLRVNARAFAHHPEQGSLDLAGLRDRMGSTWFDPEGLIMVEDVSGAAPRLAAFHWTKADPTDDDEHTGEVYVVAVDPDHQGRGLGALVTRLGLDHLRSRGLTRVVLYVEADNRAAMATYTRQGFSTVATDVRWSRPAPSR
ncbi:mycothiol synthase [Arsenicicoccus dermatophilus]|uniref:mycothiol synthase n=1 Tax=Arsenicicoccus dermatophilus TaxID=1076331 RepID=UPI001F4CFE62|nr:mycothiol synthase [Arsenicicoccus dermatophilus]MCH8611970.1 mycothiol synthase [Arsenicicoccus dermatophilus]